MGDPSSGHRNEQAVAAFTRLCAETAEKWAEYPRLDKIPLSPGSVLSRSWTEEALITAKREHFRSHRTPALIAMLTSPVALLVLIGSGAVVSDPLAWALTSSLICSLALAIFVVNRDPEDDYRRIRVMVPELRADYLIILDRATSLGQELAVEPNGSALAAEVRATLSGFLEEYMGASPRYLKRYAAGMLRGDCANRHFDRMALDLAIDTLASLDRMVRDAAP